ncbi:transposase [Mesorhizobium sp. C280B]|uniref:IS66 family transposase n=1 Tax=unclassified Mesorhizobium TaxID=325217 RepID=UPI001FD9E5A8|nr:transposase [Mesorhizobium sp. LSJC280B00]
MSRRSTGSSERYGGSRPPSDFAARRRRTRPLVRALRRQLKRRGNGLSRHADIAKAFAYGTRRWRAFNRFLYDGQLEPDNLIAERAIRIARPCCCRSRCDRRRGCARNLPSARAYSGPPQRVVSSG